MKAMHESPRPLRKAGAVHGRVRTLGGSIICPYCLEDFKAFGFVPLSFTSELVDIVDDNIDFKIEP